jgi:hypothetical protein
MGIPPEHGRGDAPGLRVNFGFGERRSKNLVGVRREAGAHG